MSSEADDSAEDEDADDEYYPISGDAGLLRCNGTSICQSRRGPFLFRVMCLLAMCEECAHRLHRQAPHFMHVACSTCAAETAWKDWHEHALRGLVTATRSSITGEIGYDGKCFATITDYAEYVRPKGLAYEDVRFSPQPH